MRSSRKWMIGAAAVVLAGGVGLNVLARNHARAMMKFAAGGEKTRPPDELSLGEKVKTLLAGVNVPRPRAKSGPREFGLACESVRIPSGDGLVLGAWYCAGGEGTPVAVLFHGYAAEKSTLLPEAAVFREMGLSVLLADFRGSGESSGSDTTIGFDEAEDVAAAARYVGERLPQRRVILYGQSMGAAAVLRAIDAHGVEPDAVIAEAVFDRLLTTAVNRFRAMGLPSFPTARLLTFWGGRLGRFDGFAHNPVDNAGSVWCPALFLHGADDRLAKAEEGRRVFDAVPGKKEFVEFPSVGHEAVVSRSPNEWRRAVQGFLRSQGLVEVLPGEDDSGDEDRGKDGIREPAVGERAHDAAVGGEAQE